MAAHAACGMDYVLVARAETATRPFQSLLQDLETALRRLRMWRCNGEAGAHDVVAKAEK